MTSPPKASLIPVGVAMSLLAACGLALDEQARFDRAKQAVDAGDLSAAQIDLKVILQENPQNVDARLLLGDVLMRVGDVPGAASELTGAIELLRRSDSATPNANRQLLEATAKLAASQLALREFPAALANAQAVIALGPE